jgi:hypothetical protein
MHLRVPLAFAVAILACTGCVRESVAADAAEFHFKWWAWLWGLVPLGVAWLAWDRHPSTWIDGAWRPWWKFRDWGHRDLLSFFGCIVLAVIMPFQTAGRLVVDSQGIVQSNSLGLKPTRAMPWSSVARLDLTGADDADLNLADRIKEAKRKSRPSVTAVLKNGQSEAFRGWLVDAALPEIISRARAAGVPVIGPPGANAAPGGQPAFPAPPAGAPFGNEQPGAAPAFGRPAGDRLNRMRERAGRPQFDRPAGGF